jgi:hypothetical protein
VETFAHGPFLISFGFEKKNAWFWHLEIKIG